MHELYAFATPSSLKPVTLLDEMGLDYELRAVDLRQGEQRSEAFRAMNPNAKVPLIIDRKTSNGFEVIFSDSSAIFVYLAEKSGHLLPSTPATRLRRGGTTSSAWRAAEAS